MVLLFLQVVEVHPDDGSGRGPRIGCSLKLVNQTDGTDLDPQVIKRGGMHGVVGGWGGIRHVGECE